MFYKKPGIPEEGEIIIGTVKKITPHSIFVNIDEYREKEGMIHISEVAPGRIRNVRDFVREGKLIVCKVLRLHKDKDHIDLSLRRVPLGLKRKKEEEYKLEQKAEKLLESIAKELKLSMAELYQKAAFQIIEEYESLNNFFKEVLSDDLEAFKNLKIDKKILDILYTRIKEKIKLPESIIETTISISSKDSDGLERIKRSLKKALELAKQKHYNVEISYNSAPKYSLLIRHPDPKSAEKILDEIISFLTSISKTENLETEWQKKT